MTVMHGVYSTQTKYEKKVIVQTYKPTALSLLVALKEHDDSTDTDLAEWEVDVDKIANEPSQNLAFQSNRYRWEITLTRRIK